jgi:hypothetical protein
MKRWLLAWELGHGLGHLAGLTAAARQALLHGIEPVIASSTPLSESITLPAGCRFLLTPPWPVVAQPWVGTSSLTELLFDQGFAQPEPLATRVQRWRDVIDLVAPSAVLTDHAPTALLTARALAIPAVQLGTGFAIPPVKVSSGLPSFRDWEAPNTQRMAQAESAIAEALRHACVITGLPLAGSVSALYDSPAVIRSVPMLDHYPPSLRGETGETGKAPSYCGPLELAAASSDTSIPVWPGAAGHQGARILAYLKAAHPLTLPLLNALAQRPGQPSISALVYVEGAQGIGNPHAHIHIQNTPLPFNALLQGTSTQPGAELVIHQGGIGASSQALLAGVAQLLLPDMAEAFITARTLLREGVAELLRPEASGELLKKTLERMIDADRASYRARAAGVAAQNAAFAGDNSVLMWRQLTQLLPSTAFN